MESDNQARGSMTLGKIPLLDETTKSGTSDKERWTETEEPVAGMSQDSYLTHSQPDMTPIQENVTQDMWLQEICESQGDYEQEVTFGHEAEPYKRYKRCTKNPGHVQFIDVNSFRSEHLPKRYQGEQKLTDLVRALAGVTCLIKVSYVSPDRPQTLPFYKYRGRSDFSRSGTGWVWQMVVYTEEDKRNGCYHRPCECPTCQGSGEPRSEWAVVIIRTASHVVFDKSEAEACKCYFFYDNAQQKLTDCPVLSATHLHQVESNSDDDASEIVYYVHDLVSVRKLKDMSDRYYSLCRDLGQKYDPIRHVVTARAAEEKDNDKNKDDTTQVQLLSDKDKNNSATGHGVQDHICHGEDYHQEDNVSEKHNGDLVIITSHPHGFSKMVTVGHVTNRHDKNNHIDNNKSSYEYSTATCPGSSGAPVYGLGRWYGRTYHPHSGHVRGQGPQQINHSGVH